MQNNNYEDASDDGFAEVQQPSPPSANAGDAETADVVSVDFSHQEPPSPFSTTKCEGYGDTRGRCPHYAYTKVMCGSADDESFRSLCELCFAEFESDRRQAEHYEIPGDGLTEIQQPSTSSNPDDAEVADVHFVNATPAFQCEGYGPARGLCQNAAWKLAWYWGTGHNLCAKCHGEYRADLDQARRDEIDD